MALYFFTIPTQPPQDEFNRFCEIYRIVSIESLFVGDSANAYWTLCTTAAAAGVDVPVYAEFTDKWLIPAESSSGCRFFSLSN